MPYCKICGEFAYTYGGVRKLEDGSNVVTKRCNNDHLNRFTETMNCKKCGDRVQPKKKPEKDGVKCKLTFKCKNNHRWSKTEDRYKWFPNPKKSRLKRSLASIHGRRLTTKERD